MTLVRHVGFQGLSDSFVARIDDIPIGRSDEFAMSPYLLIGRVQLHDSADGGDLDRRKIVLLFQRTVSVSVILSYLLFYLACFSSFGVPAGHCFSQSQHLDLIQKFN